jgi:hypothetical protein
MKLFERSGGLWIFGWSIVYFIVGMVDLFVFKTDWFPWVQIGWLFVIALPLVCNPLARYLNMKETHMFDWFNKDKTPNNVVPFPNAYDPPKTPYLDPVPSPKKESKTYYTLGLTDDNRVSFQMGYTTLTMNDVGIQQLIDQLEFFKNQLEEK